VTDHSPENGTDDQDGSAHGPGPEIPEWLKAASPLVLFTGSALAGAIISVEAGHGIVPGIEAALGILGLAMAGLWLALWFKHKWPDPAQTWSEVAQVITRLGAGTWHGLQKIWSHPGRGRVLACIVAAAAAVAMGLTALPRLVTDHHATCPVPVELRVLTSQEDFQAIQGEIPDFESHEPRHVKSSCYVVHLSAYAAPDVQSALTFPPGLNHGSAQGTALAFAQLWGQAALVSAFPSQESALTSAGPRPDIWIPSSTAEVKAVTSVAARYGSDAARPKPLGSIGDSPLVIAVATGLLPERLVHGQSWSTLYRALRARGAGLAMPDPGKSEAGLFGIAGLYGAVRSSADRRAIEAQQVNFPPDSESLICAGYQAGAQPGTVTSKAYLVSEVAMASYDMGHFTGGACATGGRPQPLTALYPAGTPALDFPFTTVNWGHNQTPVRRRYERDFFQWLKEPGRLGAYGIRTGGCDTEGMEEARGAVYAEYPGCADPRVPSDRRIALAAFTRARIPARILIGIDDSWTMEPYLPDITKAVDDLLGPAGAPLGARDSFGIWKLPGPAVGQTETELVNLEAATAANRHHVGHRLGVLTGHSNSAVYDMLVDAAQLLRSRPETGRGVIDSVVLLTDGDGYPQGDPHGYKPADVAAEFRNRASGGPPISLFVIAYGPRGCTQPLLGLADLTHGTCYSATASSSELQLAKVLGGLSTGG
jgi:Ca-activated chloride channel homolog